MYVPGHNLIGKWAIPHPLFSNCSRVIPQVGQIPVLSKTVPTKLGDTTLIGLLVFHLAELDNLFTNLINLLPALFSGTENMTPVPTSSK